MKDLADDVREAIIESLTENTVKYFHYAMENVNEMKVEEKCLIQDYTDSECGEYQDIHITGEITLKIDSGIIHFHNIVMRNGELGDCAVLVQYDDFQGEAMEVFQLDHTVYHIEKLTELILEEVE